ncbi:regulatory protein CII [Microcystis phage Mwe-Yong1]|nr:regulatory protein CII [Microcystis phage Mwe-Yong1]
MQEMTRTSYSEPGSLKVAAGYDEDVAGKGALPNRIARLISRALKDARRDRDLSRADIARLMSSELGRKITEGAIEGWAGEADLNHRIPLDAFIALISVTETTDLLGFIPEQFGFVAVPSKYAPIIELQLLEEQERELAERKARLQAHVRALK